MLAALVGNPNLQLDSASTDYDGKSEAAYFAANIKAVADHYPVKWLDQKTVDWINLLQCVGAVYGGRIFAARAARSPPKLATVTAIRPEGVKPAEPVMRQGPVAPVRRAEQRQASDLPVGLAFGEVPGVGKIEFPPDHPMMGGRSN